MICLNVCFPGGSTVAVKVGVLRYCGSSMEIQTYMLSISGRGGQARHPVLPRSVLLPLTFAEEFLVAS